MVTKTTLPSSLSTPKPFRTEINHHRKLSFVTGHQNIFPNNGNHEKRDNGNQCHNLNNDEKIDGDNFDARKEIKESTTDYGRCIIAATSPLLSSLCLLSTSLSSSLSHPFSTGTMTTPSSITNDAYVISAFDTYVRPTYNPILTEFSIQLTNITQRQVDVAPRLDIVLFQYYMQWLRSLRLIDDDGNRIGHWSFVTWGDSDIMNTLRCEVQHKKYPFELPKCFDRWINLKDDSIFKKHYGYEPRGGLQSCVESVLGKGSFEGRAHNGFIDSINTAKIVRHMVQTGFRFTRYTRGLDAQGMPFGTKRHKTIGT